MIPPLEYEKVFRLKNDFPHLSIEINGGIKTIDEGFRLMTSNGLDGFMVGRLAI
jgi:tRNA-dihydrouridine synthase A